MLQHLSIKNYAIIEDLEIDFSKGMNIITGETGAGKSIIIGALNLILGERADSSVLANKEKKCIIEASFNVSKNKWISRFLEEDDLDEQPLLLVRREITASGKSRAFVNDTPVNLSRLHDLSQLLADLHQQFDTLSLSDNVFQINVMDALSETQSEVGTYQTVYRKWKQNLKELEALKQQQAQFEKENDYNQFQYDELSALQFREDELEELEVNLKALSNAGDIKAALSRVHSELAESEQPIIQQFKSWINLLGSYSDHHKDLSEITERLRSAQIELDDIASDMERLNDRIDTDTTKIEELTERISAGYKLQKKHGVQTTNELLTIQKELKHKLEAILQIGDQINEAEQQTKTLEKEVLAVGEKISSTRKKQIPVFEKKVKQLLSQVGMPNASLKVSMDPQPPAQEGLDRIKFLFDANKSGQYQLIGKVASGGELSRLMLCIKSLVAEKMDMPTLIFDEIDSGISGEAARQVGLIMKSLADNRQVICITHQPQIAGKADAHFFVYKELVNERVKANIRLLDTEERITTIARMLSGEKPTAAALQNAREMVQH